MIFLRRLFATITLAASLGLAAPAAAQSSNVTIVYDVSGSMWGQIDGVAKVTIARDVLGGMLQSWPADRNLGVIAYGHRREGDCTDIEQVVPLGPLDAAAVSARINGLMPRGRTPLTQSVRMAAESMRYIDEPATVILVTDGLETCNADPCALAGELARAGVNFTAHVVGFDIAEADRAQVSCIAEATGGLFVPAGNAEELTEALQQVTMAEPSALPVTLRAVDARNGMPLGTADWQISAEGGEMQTTAGSASLQMQLDPGAYRIAATAPGYAGEMALTVDAQTVGIVDVPLEKIMATLVLRAVDAQTGLPVSGVDWVLLNTATEESVTQNASGDRLPLLIAAGDYRITASEGARSGAASVTASLAQDREVVVELAEVLPDASVQTAAEIPAGSQFTVEWTGPNAQSDYITIVPAGAPERDYGDYQRSNQGSPARLTAPDALGAHEVRYVLHEGRRVLAAQTVTLTPVSAALTAPDTALAGAVIEVQWEGPNNPRDYITVVEAGAPEGTYTDYQRTNQGSPSRITMPDALGAYELRYVIQQSGRTLASRPITLEAVAASLTAPDTAAAGSVVEVQWEGPNNPRDYITVVEAGAPEGTYTDYQRTNNGSPARIIMPDALGAYELRYVIQQSGRTLASRPITLEAVAASLTAPDTAAAGSVVEVQWEGPNNPRDYITVVEAGAPEGTYTDYQRTNQGSPSRITMPDALGAYELRYVIQQSGRTLASRPITLEAVAAQLLAPSEIPAGSVVEVQWQGPNNERDYITIVEAGAPEGTYMDYARTNQGSPARITVPDALGAYELRYVIQQSGRTLASLPVTLTAVTASLDAPETIVPGGRFEVNWQGPNNPRDYITIVARGAPEGSYLDYARTNQGSPVRLDAPDEPGDYELRYVIQSSGRTLSSVPVTVGVGEISLTIIDEVTAGGVVTIEWTGPGRYEDFIQIVPVGAPDDADALRESRASQGSPVQLFAPPSAGQYELRYRASDSGDVLARTPFEVP
ncbi:vWA domain-containing protein [Pararhodobacter oceanensis]|uniref:vWA domain-containing protein n=1 Tax=Pararhodobacter oceanensis TaxID=2172121 RepID=UPI003A8E1CAD